MSDLQIIFEDGLVKISFPIGSASNSSVCNRIEQVVPLLRSLLHSDIAVKEHIPDDMSNKTRAILALDMSCQAHIYNAQSLSQKMKLVAEGSESISLHGFPEFEVGGEMYDD